MLGVRSRAIANLLCRAAPAKSAGKAAGKKAAKGEANAAGPVVPVEVRETTVVGANLLKDGKDPLVGPDEDYPPWLWQLLDKKPPLSELKRKRIEDMSMGELERLVKLDNRESIKSLNLQKAKA